MKTGNPTNKVASNASSPIARRLLLLSLLSLCSLWLSLLLVAGCGGGSSDRASTGIRPQSTISAAASRPAPPENVVVVPATWSKGLSLFGVRNPKDPEGVLYGYLDESGKTVIKPQYANAHDFHGSLAAVQLVKNGPWGYIDTLGRLFIPAQFADAQDFSEEKAAVSKDGKLWGYIDTTGKMAIQPQYERAAWFSDGMARVMVPNSSDLVYINHHGKEVVRLKNLDNGLAFSEGLAAASRGQKWGYINKHGDWAIPAHYTDAQEFHNNYAVVATGIADDGTAANQGVIDKKGHWVIQPKFEVLDNPSEVLMEFGVRKPNFLLWGIADMKGRVVVQPAYVYANPFVEGYAAVCIRVAISDNNDTRDDWGFIDHKGTMVIPAQFSCAGDFHNGRATVTTHDGQWGWIDSRGKWMWGPFPLGK